MYMSIAALVAVLPTVTVLQERGTCGNDDECEELLEWMSTSDSLGPAGDDHALCGRDLLFRRHGVSFRMTESFVQVQTLRSSEVRVACCGSACAALSGNISVSARLVGNRIHTARVTPSSGPCRGDLVIRFEAHESGQYQLEATLDWLNGQLFAPPGYRYSHNSVFNGEDVVPLPQRVLGPRTWYHNEGFQDERCRFRAQVHGGPVTVLALGDHRPAPTERCGPASVCGHGSWRRFESWPTCKTQKLCARQCHDWGQGCHGDVQLANDELGLNHGWYWQPADCRIRFFQKEEGLVCLRDRGLDGVFILGDSLVQAIYSYGPI